MTTCRDAGTHAPHFDGHGCPGVPPSAYSTEVADHISVTAHPDQPWIAIKVRNQEVLLTLEEWGRFGAAGEAAAMRIRLRPVTS